MGHTPRSRNEGSHGGVSTPAAVARAEGRGYDVGINRVGCGVNKQLLVTEVTDENRCRHAAHWLPCSTRACSSRGLTSNTDSKLVSRAWSVNPDALAQTVDHGAQFDAANGVSLPIPAILLLWPRLRLPLCCDVRAQVRMSVEVLIR